MPEGMSELERNILRFEGARDELHAAVRDAHAVLKDLRDERKIIDRMMHDDVKKRVNDKVDKVVRSELERIGPEIKKQTSLIYAKVGEQIDKLINLSLGSEFSTKKGKSDIRPVLAARLRALFYEIINEETEKAHDALKEASLASDTD